MTKIFTTALAGVLCLSCPARAQQAQPTQPAQLERIELASLGPSAWFIFSVETTSRPSWPSDTVLITISTQPDRLSVPSALIYYERARLPVLLEHYSVSIPLQLINKRVLLADRDNPVLEQIVRAGMSLSNIPTDVPVPDPSP
jgi:hypothetical protein